MRWILIFILMLIILGLWYRTEMTKDVLRYVGSATYDVTKAVAKTAINITEDKLAKNNVTINNLINRGKK